MKNTISIPALLDYQLEKSKALSDKNFHLWLSHNRLLYWYASGQKQNQQYHDIHLTGRKILSEFNRTLTEIRSISRGKIRYVIAKYKRPLPYIPSDIDLLVQANQFEMWGKSFRDRGFEVEDHPEFLKSRVAQKTVRKTNRVKIDLTRDFCWQNGKYFSAGFLWNPKSVKNHALGDEAEFGVTLGSIIFKRMHFNLLDYIYLIHLLRQIKTDKLYDQAVKYGWSRSLKATIGFLESIDPVNATFPLLFPPGLVRQIFLEKIKQGGFSLNYFTYYVLATLRYKISNRYLPYHVFWTKI